MIAVLKAFKNGAAIQYRQKGCKTVLPWTYFRPEIDFNWEDNEYRVAPPSKAWIVFYDEKHKTFFDWNEAVTFLNDTGVFDDPNPRIQEYNVCLPFH